MHLDATKAELLGFLAAEGNEYHYSRRYDRFFANRGEAGKWYRINYRKNAIEFTNVEPALQQRFYQLLVMTYGGQKAAFGSRYRIRIRRKATITDLLHHTRLGCLEWRVPSEVIQSHDDLVKGAWCRGYADGEATIRTSEIDLPSVNLKGLRQVQHLLQSLEIGSHLRGPYNRRPYLDNFVLVIPARHLLTYDRHIGFNHPRKRRILHEILSRPRWIASHHSASREAEIFSPSIRAGFEPASEYFQLTLAYIVQGLSSPYRDASTALRGPHPIFPEMLTYLQNNVQAAWLGALILADGECSYASFPHRGRRYYRARVRIGIYEREPIGEAARLMGVSLMGPRKGRFEAESQGSRATAVLAKIGPYILGRKSAEARYIVQHGGHVTEQVYRDFQQRFPTLRRMQGKMAWKERKGMVLRAGRSGPLRSF